MGKRDGAGHEAMSKLSFSDGLAVAGIIATILVVVLDKAQKLKGPLLIGLLGVAALMALPMLLSMPWVADAATVLQVVFRRILAGSLLVAVWAGLVIWIKPDEDKAPLIPSLEVTYNADVRQFNFVNRGSTNIYLWTTAYGGSGELKPADIPASPVTVTENGGSYHLYADEFDAKVRKAAIEAAGNLDLRVPYWVFITMDDGKKRVLKFSLWMHNTNASPVVVDTQNQGVEEREFVKQQPK